MKCVGGEYDGVAAFSTEDVLPCSYQEKNGYSVVKTTTKKTTILQLRNLVNLPPSVSIENPPCDFTPAKYITLLFTDLGVLTPSAVSDELIRLYQ